MEEKNGSVGKTLLRVAVVIAAVVGFAVALDVLLERVFKKCLRIEVELVDIDDEDDEVEECECCCDENECDCECDCGEHEHCECCEDGECEESAGDADDYTDVSEKSGE
ncbi:MAG: hypothetical protein LUI15_00700 [Firmicutes bacterium]|nr:hypothetical protein [Bacillota bacterium]